MKNSKCFLVGLVFLFTYQVQAQFSIGIKGGYTNAWAEYGDIGLPENAKIDVNGFNLSALSYFKINKHFQVGVEPGYTQRGAACFPGWGGDLAPIFNADTKFFLHYVELPLMLSGHIPFYKNRFEVSAKVGYGASFLVKAVEEKTTIGSDVPPARTTLDLNDSASVLNRWDHGLHSSIGLAYNLGINQIFIASDFYRGFNDSERFNRSENRSIDFSIGYLIRL